MPTERSEGGRERRKRCLWQIKRPERVAAVGEGRRCLPPRTFAGHRNSKTDNAYRVQQGVAGAICLDIYEDLLGYHICSNYRMRKYKDKIKDLPI